LLPFSRFPNDIQYFQKQTYFFFFFCYCFELLFVCDGDFSSYENLAISLLSYVETSLMRERIWKLQNMHHFVTIWNCRWAKFCGDKLNARTNTSGLLQMESWKAIAGGKLWWVQLEGGWRSCFGKASSLRSYSTPMSWKCLTWKSCGDNEEYFYHRSNYREEPIEFK
jgi:hypothetical protein